MIRISRKRKNAHPKEPWLWLDSWAERRVEHSHVADGVALLVFAAMWNGVAIPIAWIVSRQGGPWFAKVIIYAFVLLGVLMIWGAIRKTIIGIRHGRSTLVLADVPQRLGRKFSARVEMTKLPGGGISSTLRCEKRQSAKGGPQVLWKEEREVLPASVHRGPMGVVIPVEFALPADGLESENLGEIGEVSWHLMVDVGNTTSASFPIPVFGGRQEPKDEFEVALDEYPDEEVRRKIREELAR